MDLAIFKFTLKYCFYYYSFKKNAIPASPCTTHKRINDVGNRGTRCSESSSPLICDRPGFEHDWYVASYKGEYIQMPETFPNPVTCGTESPIWINGKLLFILNLICNS